MDGWTDSPCVLQDFVPLGAAALLPLNLNHIQLKQGTGTADHFMPVGCYSGLKGALTSLKSAFELTQSFTHMYNLVSLGAFPDLRS